MSETEVESGGPGGGETIIVDRRRRAGRILGWIVIGLLIVVLAAIAILWMERRPIARNVIDHQLAGKGVKGSYRLDRVGLRTQQISNVVIGDPAHPDVTAKTVQVQMRIRWNGNIDVYRIVARGVRLRGTVGPKGKVSWGQIDELLPPPSGKPFSLPDVSVDVADSSISLSTPWGPLGFAVVGSGNLTGGFTGRFVSSSPRLLTKTCQAINVRGSAAIEIKARHPHVIGPLTAASFACPASRISVVEPRLELNANFAEGFNNYDASARIMSRVLTAGDNGLADLNGRITFAGDPADTKGAINLAARKSRLGTISADRTRLSGRYRLRTEAGTLVMAGHYAANGASLAPAMISGLTGALQATASTPVGPVASAIGNAISKSAGSFDVSGGLRLDNLPHHGSARVTDATIDTATGGHATITGGNGVSYFWPSGALRLDGTLRMSGGGLPTGFVTLHQSANGAISGAGHFQPYTAAGTRLALSTLDFQAQPNGSTRFSTLASLSGNFSGGRVSNLHLPIDGRVGPNGSILIGQSCTIISFDQVRMQQLELGRTRFPICPTGAAIISRSAGGALSVGGRIDHPAIAGRIGSAPMRVIASSVLLSQSGFSGRSVELRLGKPESPVAVNAGSLSGAFVRGGASGVFAKGDGTIGNVPLQMTEMGGHWRFVNGRLAIDGGLLVNDRVDPSRFYPLKSNDVHFVLDNNRITATGILRHPGTGTEVTDVSIAHNLNSGDGHAILDVPGITFGPNIQPDELTRLTEGVVALVQGTVSGQGRINWSRSGAVASTGDFTTRSMDLAAPFGPVAGLSTSIHFNDLLGLTTPPGQAATIASVNPGILVENGVVHYQLLPHQLVKVERGEWPFMGGRLILQPTILNFGSPSAKRLTFQLVGLDSKTFIDNLGFPGLAITGKFDGVLPMIFDENGGRIVGGRLDSRPPGGEFAYEGTKPKAGIVAGLAFDLLSDVNYKSMIIRLDGDLAGEFATRFTIEQVSLGHRGGFLAGLARGAFSNIPLKVNLNISGPFRALIQMAKGFKDPTNVIAPVMPFPLDSPGIVTETHLLKKDEEQTATTLVNQIDVSTKVQPAQFPPPPTSRPQSPPPPTSPPSEK